jgi:hypothetical protein
MQALRAQAASNRGLPSSKQQSLPDGRDIRFVCCNDVIAPPMWALLLVHCPEYLKQLWELSSEAKQVIYCLCLLIGDFVLTFILLRMIFCAHWSLILSGRAVLPVVVIQTLKMVILQESVQIAIGYKIQVMG